MAQTTVGLYYSGMAIELTSKIEGTDFYWASALFLPKWQIHCYPGAEVQKNIEATAKKLQLVKDFFKAKECVISSFLRPPSYNDLVKGAANSAHIQGLAVDFWMPTFSCDYIREKIEPKLEEWQIRCEDLPKSSWVHLDLRIPLPNHSRMFKP